MIDGKHICIACIALAAGLSLMPLATFGEDRPTELGLIPWLRDFDAALAESKKTRKPVMLLFDEVPGCSTCKKFGTGPLSHPIVVDAAREFVSAAIYNNVPGRDAAVLKKYREPAWNNPVVRFVSPTGRDLVPRLDGDYTTGGLLAGMVQSLKKARRPVPEYLALVANEYRPRRRETATFAMHCYWEGEMKLGSLDGVLATHIGMLDGNEVVELDFDPTQLPYRKLVSRARKLDCVKKVYARSKQQARTAKQLVRSEVVRTDARVDTSTTQQYHLANTPAYHYLPLTQLQATKVNAALAVGGNPSRFLSPSQRALILPITSAMAGDAQAFSDLVPDRTPHGVSHYAARLRARLDAR